MTNLREALDDIRAQANAATESSNIGDFGETRLVPADYTVITTDVRQFEELPRSIDISQEFLGAASLAAYIEGFRDSWTKGYVLDQDENPLTQDSVIIRYVLDEHDRLQPRRRSHRASLIARPTEAALRWGNAFDHHLSQQEFVDLITDGAAEIGAPDAADLRELISNLRAARSSEVQSVVLGAGGTQLRVEENVTLMGGPGNLITIPETMRVALTPFVAHTASLLLNVRITPVIATGRPVSFRLVAVNQRSQLHRMTADIAAEVQEITGDTLLWQPT